MFCFQAFSFVGILLWILEVCKCVHVKASWSTRCWGCLERCLPLYSSSLKNIRQVGESSQRRGIRGMIKRYSKINTWFNQLYLIILGVRRITNDISPCTNSVNLWAGMMPNEWNAIWASFIFPFGWKAADQRAVQKARNQAGHVGYCPISLPPHVYVFVWWYFIYSKCICWHGGPGSPSPVEPCASSRLSAAFCWLVTFAQLLAELDDALVPVLW